MKKWTRCIAALAIGILLGTSAGTVSAAETSTQQNIWSSNAARVLTKHYELSDKVAAVYLSGGVQTGADYQVTVPYQNGTEGQTDLVAVDYQTKTVYAKAYAADGYIWNPASAVIEADGEEQETITLTAGAASYENEKYDATGAFSYNGHDYTVTMTYELYVTIDAETQEQILETPQILAQAVKNLEKDLKGMRYNLIDLGETAPYLYQLLSVKFTVEDQTGKSTTEPAFDPRKDAAEIKAIRRLNSILDEEGQLPLYVLCEDYRACGVGRVNFAITHGQEVIDAAKEIIDDLKVLKNSQRFRTVCTKVKNTDTVLYEHIKNTSNNLREMVGTDSNPGPADRLCQINNWKILDEDVRKQILVENTDNTTTAKLEAAAYVLRNTNLTPPTVDSESILAVTAEISEHIVLYDVTASYAAQIVSDKVGDTSLQDLETSTVTVTLPAGVTAEEVQAALEETGTEKAALESWNMGDYRHINVANYNREETTFKGGLVSDITDYMVRYTPKTCTVKTNFTDPKKLTVPYGYRLELPESGDSETEYDYVVETTDGTATSYEQGSIYLVGADAQITRSTGTEKREYRLYDFLADDTRYEFSEEAQQILKNTAVKSPWLKIRMPEEDAAGEIEEVGKKCQIKAVPSSSGVSGMTWKPYEVILMKNGKEYKHIAFDEKGIATWKKESNVIALVRYQMQITKMKASLIGYKNITSDDVYVAVNIPDTLVKDTARQSALLGGATNSAKYIYEQMTDYKALLTQSMLKSVQSNVTSSEAKKAVDKLMTSEQKGGGFNGDYDPNLTDTDQIALYKYLTLAEQAGWSLTDSYTTGQYAKIEEQSELVAECL